MNDEIRQELPFEPDTNLFTDLERISTRSMNPSDSEASSILPFQPALAADETGTWKGSSFSEKLS